MCACITEFSVCEYKTYSKRKNYMLTLGLETTQFVSEVPATSGCGKQPPFRNVHPWKQS